MKKKSVVWLVLLCLLMIFAAVGCSAARERADSPAAELTDAVPDSEKTLYASWG